jgi:hypothetical protein
MIKWVGRLGGLLRRLVGVASTTGIVSSPSSSAVPKDTAAAQPPTNPYQAGSDRVRQTATWLVGVLAAVATVMLAGSQLSGIGSLSLTDDRWRLAVAVGSALLAIGAVSYAVFRLTEIQMPGEGTLTSIRESAERSTRLKQLADGDSGLRAGRADLIEFLDYYEARRRTEWDAEAEVVVRETAVAAAATPAEREAAAAALAAADGARSRAAAQVAALRPNLVQLGQLSSYLAVRTRFERERPRILGAALATAVLLICFAWAANPPQRPSRGGSVLDDQPSSGRLALTADGRVQLAGVLGTSCAGAAAAGSVPVIALARSEAGSEIVLVPGGDCPDARRLTVPTEWGVVLSTSTVPLTTPAPPRHRSPADLVRDRAQAAGSWERGPSRRTS